MEVGGLCMPVNRAGSKRESESQHQHQLCLSVDVKVMSVPVPKDPSSSSRKKDTELDIMDRKPKMTTQYIGRLTVQEFNAIDMMRLMGKDSVTCQELAMMLNKTYDSTTRLMSRWKIWGLFRRAPTPNTFTEVLVEVTELGWQFYEEADAMLLAKGEEEEANERKKRKGQLEL